MRLIVLGALAAFITGPAAAATFTFAETLDLHGPSPQNLPYPIDLAEGDTLDLTVDFAGDQHLRYNFDTIYLGVSSQLGPATTAFMSGALQLFGRGGGVIYHRAVANYGTGGFGAGIGQAGGFPSELDVYGIRVVGTLVNYETPGVTSRTYARFGYAIFGTSVPEPSTWGIMLLGLGGAGALLRQRRTVEGRCRA